MLSLFKKSVQPSSEMNSKQRSFGGNALSLRSKSKIKGAVKTTVDEDSSRELSKFQYPEHESGLTDHIISHKRGEDFQHVVLSSHIPENASSILSRLRNLKAKSNVSELNIGTIPYFDLVDDTHTFEFSDLIRSMQKKPTKKFLYLQKIQILYAPTMSANDTFSKVKVQLYDGRYTSNNIVRSVHHNSNFMCASEIFLDYCIPISSIDQLKLIFSIEVQILQENQIWASIKMEAVVKELDFPEQTAMTETTCVTHIPQTLMNIPDRNPRYLDQVMNDEDLSAVRKMKVQGDIKTSGVPQRENNRKVTLANTSYGKACGSDNSSIIDDIGSERSSRSLSGWQENVNQSSSIPEERTSRNAVNKVAFTDI